MALRVYGEVMGVASALIYGVLSGFRVTHTTHCVFALHVQYHAPAIPARVCERMGEPGNDSCTCESLDGVSSDIRPAMLVAW